VSAHCFPEVDLAVRINKWEYKLLAAYGFIPTAGPPFPHPKAKDFPVVGRHKGLFRFQTAMFHKKESRLRLQLFSQIRGTRGFFWKA